MNMHQSVEDILKTASPEQRLLWNYIFLRWGERVPVSQLFYEGTTGAAGELAVYSANKIYIAYEFEMDGAAAAQVAPIYVQFFNEANAFFQTIANNAAFWDTTAAAPKYLNNNARKQNFYFSRLAAGAVASNIKFIGYRIGV